MSIGADVGHSHWVHVQKSSEANRGATRNLNRPNNPTLINDPIRRAPTVRQHIEAARRRQIPSRVDTGGVDGAFK
jgi:hypothetical protein